MPTDARALAVIVTLSIVTIGLRLVPFVAGEKTSSSAYLRFLGEKMPTGVMILLVAYTLKDLDVVSYPYGLPTFLPVVLAVALYWRTSNSLLSIGVGLAAHMVAVNVIV